VSFEDCTIETLVRMYQTRARDVAQQRTKLHRLDQERITILQELLRRGVRPADPRRTPDA